MSIIINSSDLLTPEQLDNHIKIYAGPGAGKTHFLVENVKNIVTINPLVAQSRARKVLCITYTNAAVDEIKRRLERFSASIEAHTIHGFIIEHIIKPFQEDLRQIMKEDFNIVVGGKGKITSQVEGVGILHGVNKSDIFEFIESIVGESDEFTYSKKILGQVEVDIDLYRTDNKAKLRASRQIKDSHIIPIKQYTWSKVRKLTHNEILYFGYRILQRNNTALYATRVKFPFIFVDEFQDTNPLQTLLIKLIGSKSTVIGTIGDAAQSIYSFQGAKPSQFLTLNIDSNRALNEYVISGNRRSTTNIVNLCNFLRKSDSTVVQNSEKHYNSNEEKQSAEKTKIHIISGEDASAKQLINSVIADGAVVLTRTWAAAFSYIQDINEEQEKCLKAIYNSYYTSPIDIRSDIVEHNYVTWVRAFKFIFRLWNGYKTGALVEIITACTLLTDFDTKKLTPKIIAKLKLLTDEVFGGLLQESLTIDIINGFSMRLHEENYAELVLTIWDGQFSVPIFDDEDRDEIRTNVSLLSWYTSYKLFAEVFSEDSRYMTVHQAKGREWEKVIVSLEPNSRRDRDNITLSGMFSNPQLLNEENAEEFTRMYYVACSRAKVDLYLHLKKALDITALQLALDNYNQSHEDSRKIDYEILPLQAGSVERLCTE
ncbi:MAG: ATP-dependent helicase [Paenibacillaceae bacterium]|nr:ATP-dependent helicase [Paenibacillaceae bacterium]